MFKLSKPKRLKSRHGLPDMVSEGVYVYRALSELDADGAWGTWLGEQRDASGNCEPVLLKHTGENNRTRAGADALWLEALLTLKLDGPHVVPLVDYGVLDGRPFAVYGFEEGVFLAQVIEGLRERNRRLPSGVAVGIVLQACELVRRLHKLRLGEEATGLVHGALCPRNFLLTERGDVKVMGLIGVRPVGRIVGREHVPPAAAQYASPDLLGGAPVTPAVDVYSLAAVLQELIGAAPAEGEADELAKIVRSLLAQGPGGGFSNVDAFASALQEAVRRTGTVVARQSIGAQVRGVCEQYLLERRRQVRMLREAEWPEQRERASSRPPAAAAGVPVEEREATAEELDESADEAPVLGAYEEDTGDDAVTRIYDGEELESDGTAQPQAWMHDSRPVEAARAGWTRWALVALLGVLVAVASGAAVMAIRSGGRASEAVAATRDVAPSAAVAAAASAGSSKGTEAKPAGAVAPTSALAAVHDAQNSERAIGSGPAASGSLGEQAASEGTSDTPKVKKRRTARQRLAARRAAAQRRAAAAARRAERAAASSENAPATVDVQDLPEADEAEANAEEEEAEEEAAAAGDEASEADEDLVIEEEGPEMAFLSVDASPYATVFIDGENKGVTPLVGLELTPGVHRMVAKTEDGRTKRFTLQLEPGKTETVKMSWEE